MPFYPGDFTADTLHLSDAEVGSYVLLIVHYWAHGGLPSDDERLQAIARSDDEKWTKTREALASFFYDGWHHKRIDHELKKQRIISAKRALAGHRGGLKSGLTRLGSERVPKRSKRQATTTTFAKPSFGTESEHTAPPQAASDEASKGLTASPELVALVNDPAHRRRK
jgi:uncharacterized protein YdaU (DUF1376 family)